MTRQAAFEGGAPRFAEPRHVSRPDTSEPDRFLDSVREILASRWLTNDGATLRRFEERFAQVHAVRHCVAVSSGTAGLELALAALELAPGSEVILPSFTFIATAQAVTRVGLVPVFCDVDADSWNLDPAQVCELVTSRTAAILPVHLFGNAAPIDALQKIAAERGLRVLYDAAHTVGATFRGRPFGGGGEAEVLSFHATKIFTTFEGGAVLTNDGPLAERLRLLRNFGFAGYDRVVALGTNAKLNEVSAAFGLATLDRVPGRVAHNRTIFLAYREGLAEIPGLALHEAGAETASNHHYVPITIDSGSFGLSRDALYRFLWEENVRARRYFHPGCHRMAPYREDPALRRGPLPVTEDLLGRILCLPTGPGWTTAETGEVVALLAEARERAGAVEAWSQKRSDP